MNLRFPVLSCAFFAYVVCQSACLAGDSYVFTQIFAPAAERLDRFGEVMVIERNQLAVGVERDNVVGSRSGSVMRFDLDGAYHGILVPDDTQDDDRFGISLDFHDGLIIGGAWGDDDLGPYAGSAYVFDAQSGTQLFKLLPDDGVGFDQFGHSVGVSSGILAVGSASDDDLGSMTGAVYFYDADTGAQLQKLVPADGGRNQNFGVRLMFRDEWLIICATGDDDQGADSGSVYVYRYPELNLVHKLVPDDLVKDDFFGNSISLYENTLAVGTLREDGARVYLFDLVSGQIIQKLSAPDGRAGDGFGISVSLSDRFVFVGADRADGVSLGSGAVYVFDRDSGEQATKLFAGNGATGDRFGASVASSDGVLCVGAPYVSEHADEVGSIYLFPASCAADLNRDARLDQADLSVMLDYFAKGDERADFYPDGVLDYFDISVYLGLFRESCFPVE